MTAAPVAGVSVIIPVHNHAAYLGEAIGSALAQRCPPLEVIVVDDGSTDGSGAVAARFGEVVRTIRQEQGGTGAARNRGVAAARGEFLAFLDADDCWVPEKLWRQLAAFAADPGLDMVFGWLEQFHSPELDDAARARIYRPPDPMPGYSSGTLLIRRAAFARVGPFGDAWRVGEFMDWFLRAEEAGLRSLMLPEVVLRRRLHGANQGIRQRDSRADYARVVKAALDRRRAVGAAGRAAQLDRDARGEADGG